MTGRPDQRMSWGVLRRTPQTPRLLRPSESRSARRPLPATLDVVLGEIDR
jgi:hypothetical protein